MSKNNGQRNNLTLFVITSSGSYPLMRYLASRYVKEARKCALLYMGGEDARFVEISADAARIGVETVAFESYVRPGSVRGPLRRFAFRPMLLRFLIGLSKSKAAAIQMNIFGEQLAASDEILTRFQPTAIVVGENGISGPFLFLAAAEERCIACATVPYGNCRIVDLEFDQERKRLAGERIVPSGVWRMALQWFAPKWLKKGPHEGAVMFQPGYILWLEAMGITLKSPWICLGGPLDVMCAENRLGYAQYISEGIPPAKIKLTGSPYCDEIVEEVGSDPAAAQAIHRPQLIDAVRPRILVSWPPDYHSTHIGKSEFRDYRAMTAAYMAFFKSLQDCDVTISMHPAAGDQGREVLQENDIVASNEHLVGMLGKHDIFVTFFSTAIRWAIAAGKPVVNIDLYLIEDDRFLRLPGVVHTRTFDEFRRELTGIVSSSERFAALAQHQIEASAGYGTLDGRCVERVMLEIDKAAAART